MKKVKIVLFALSALGLLLSAGVHLAIYLKINLQDYPISPFLLHLGVFITFFPSLILAIIENKDKEDELGRKAVLKNIYEDLPIFLRAFVFILYVYAMVNFILFMFTMEGSPSIIEGKYLLSNHGSIIKELSFEEYQNYRRKEILGFSGHWILFYSGAFLLSYPFRKERELVPKVERILVNHFQTDYISFQKRLYEKGKFLFIFSGLVIVLIPVSILFFPEITSILAIGLIFPLALLLNLFFFISWSKYFIRSYSIENDKINLEVYRFNTPRKYQFLIKDIKAKLFVKPIKGNELIYLVFYDKDGKEIFSQYDCNSWSPNQLKDLERAIQSA